MTLAARRLRSVTQTVGHSQPHLHQFPSSWPKRQTGSPSPSGDSPTPHWPPKYLRLWYQSLARTDITHTRKNRHHVPSQFTPQISQEVCCQEVSYLRSCGTPPSSLLTSLFVFVVLSLFAACFYRGISDVKKYDRKNAVSQLCQKRRLKHNNQPEGLTGWWGTTW